mmetsp:Transcript_131946/g.257127  ORF Transcript_131946/g.257127 Transcript_131946/m.257127 type:complete len:119 (-) Transcript_131946:862-1218(-)
MLASPSGWEPSAVGGALLLLPGDACGRPGFGGSRLGPAGGRGRGVRLAAAGEFAAEAPPLKKLRSSSTRLVVKGEVERCDVVGLLADIGEPVPRMRLPAPFRGGSGGVEIRLGAPWGV